MFLGCFSMLPWKSTTDLGNRLSVTCLNMTCLTYNITLPSAGRTCGVNFAVRPFGDTGALTVIFPLPCSSVFATTAAFASLTPKLSSNITVLASAFLSGHEVACNRLLCRTFMKYFHTHSLQGCKTRTPRVHWCSMAYVDLAIFNTVFQS